MAKYLTEIVSRKFEEVKLRKKQITLNKLKEASNYQRVCFSLKKKLINSDLPGVICEFKRASPSKGIINSNVELEQVVLGYQNAGAFAISVLTDEAGFGGTLEDLSRARNLLTIPLLRKDFIIDEYQIHEAKACGADLILLIAACLTKQEVQIFTKIAHSLGLEVLLEVHAMTELEHVCDEVDILGVNNRNLNNFNVSLDISREISKLKNISKPKISESGISSVLDACELSALGFNGFLVGESFMKTNDPGNSAKEFISSLAEEINAR